jgi:hypothetical protein
MMAKFLLLFAFCIKQNNPMQNQGKIPYLDVKFLMNFAMLKSMCKILTTYQAFCNSFCTAQNSAVPAV